MIRFLVLFFLALCSVCAFAVTEYPNLEYTLASQQLLDLYEPVPLGQAAASAPAIVFIHGGGWLAGEKEDMDYLASYYAGLGYVTVSINYRLSTVAPWPAQIDDCQAAVRWVRKYATTLHVDPNHIAAYGVSAGGHLVNVMISKDTLHDFDKNLSGYSSRVQAGVDYLGPSDFTDPSIWDPTVWTWIEQLIGELFTTADVADFKAASPAYMVNSTTAPLIMFYSMSDPIVPRSQATELDNALIAQHRVQELHLFKGAGHGLGNLEYQQCIGYEGKFLAKYIP